jgi:hypothetical protein
MAGESMAGESITKGQPLRWTINQRSGFCHEPGH